MPKINNFFHKVFAWIWYSSSDPTKTSLTVKSGLTIAASYIMTISGFTHLNLGADSVNTIVNGISTVVLDGLMTVSAVGAVVGAVNKVISTLSGKNPVISDTPTQPSIAQSQ